MTSHGKATTFKLRPTTPEERETRIFRSLGANEKPQVGAEIPLFIMQGIDGKTYRSTDLKGNVVVLSFWISLNKPFWGEKQATGLSQVLQPFQTETGLISLGVLNNTEQEVKTFLVSNTVPFVPVPESYGFHKKYQVTRSPSFLVIDRTGKIAAFIEGGEYEALKASLRQVTK
ncbi:hypothetical protein GCM10023189_00350 [Nibrella saemangeumensis]|uniref:Thioredoxin domain-containing protein n=1 Tax=Nibrella saemangeumensis TaxID=1084526 RepID=A0ABP8MAR4_9BACT